MNFRISTYLAWTLGLSALYLTAFDLQIGLAFMVAAAGILVPLAAIRVPGRFFYVMLFAAGAVWLAYLVRPLVLVPLPELFSYGRLGYPNDRVMVTALAKVGLYGASLITGLGLALRFAPVTAAPLLRVDRPLLLRLGTVFLAALALAVVMKAVLLLGFHVGQKGVQQNASVAFLQQFIPEEIIYAVCVLMLSRYGHALGTVRRLALFAVLVAFAVLVLLSGSKAFVLRIAIAAFIYFLATRGDFRIPLNRAGVAAVVGVTVLTVSFAVGVSVKRGSRDGGARLGVLREAFVQASSLARGPAFLASLSEATGRFVGFDGLIVTELSRNPDLVRVFGMGETARRIFYRFVPLDGGVSGLTSGRAVGIYYTGHLEEVQHSGAIGLFGAFQLMFGSGWLSAVGLFLLGLAGGWCFRSTERTSSYEGRFLLQYVGAYALIRWTMSGNLDVNVPVLVMQLVQLAIFYGMFRVLYAVLGRSKRSVDPLMALR